MNRRKFFSFIPAIAGAAAIPAMSDQPLRGRDPRTAAVHTKEEGGYFYSGGAPLGEFHSVIFDDGQVFDITLAYRCENGGWRHFTPEQFAEAKKLAGYQLGERGVTT